MAADVDSASAVQVITATNSATWTHTASGSNRVLYVFVHWTGVGGDQTISSITYDGVAMDSVGTISVGAPSNARVAVYRTIAPATGGADVAVTFGGNVNGLAQSVSTANTDQSTPNGSFQTGSGFSTSPAVFVSGASGDLNFGGFFSGYNGPPSGGYTYTANRTLAAKGDITVAPFFYAAGVETTAGTGGGVQMSWSLGASQQWQAYGFDVNEVIVPPVNSVAPAVTGTAQEGAELSCDTGTWSPSPTGYSYQWKSDGNNVGTDSNKYTPQSSDVGTMISCVVTASNSAGAGDPAASNEVGPVLPPATSTGSGGCSAGRFGPGAAIGI